MAWKVINAQRASGDGVSVPTFRVGAASSRPNVKTWNYKVQFGPHPVKVWIREPGKRRKVKIKATNMLAAKAARADDMTDRAKAAQYAFWLAKRDGIDLPPDAYAIPQFTTLQNPTTGKMEKRCMFVQMRVKQADLCRIGIPNWSWFPAEPVENLDQLALAA
jgi:hypothetical protein